MKKIKSILFLITITISIMFNACLEDDDYTLVLPENVDSVDINNPESVQTALIFNNGRFVNNHFPTGTTTSLYNNQESISVNSDGTVILPVFSNSSSLITEVYIQVIGANGYYSVSPTLVTNSNGMIYISFDIPQYITNGSFDVIYSVKYADGTISHNVQTAINVTNVIITCNNAFKEGNSGLTFTNVYLGNKLGNVVISYDTYTVPDRIDIYQGNTWLTGTGSNPNSPIPPICDCDSPLFGFIGDAGNLSFDYNPSNGKIIVIVVSGCLNSGTAWEWQLVESPDCQ